MRKLSILHDRRIVAIKPTLEDVRDCHRRYGTDFEVGIIGSQAVGAIVKPARNFVDGTPPPPTLSSATSYLGARRQLAEAVGVVWCGLHLRADIATRSLVGAALLADFEGSLQLPAVEHANGRPAELVVAEIGPDELPELHKLLTEHASTVTACVANGLSKFAVHGEAVPWEELDALPWPDKVYEVVGEES